MSKGQLSRTPDNFPRMKHRAAARLARRSARAMPSALRILGDAVGRFVDGVVDGMLAIGRAIIGTTPAAAPLREVLYVDPPQRIATRTQDWNPAQRSLLWPGLAVQPEPDPSDPPAAIVKTHYGVTLGYIGQSEADRLRAMPSAAEVRAMTDHVNSMMTSRRATN